jgi:glycosyltransferase involved in cell wall biosynthesis
MINFRQVSYGYIDQYSNGALHGWAWNPQDHYQKMRIDVFCRKRFIGQFTANHFREDLLSKGAGDGRYAFRARIPACLADNADLSSFEVYTSFPQRVALHRPGSQRSADWFGRKSLVEQISAMFKQLLMTLDLGFSDASTITHSTGAAEEMHLFDKLFDPSPVSSPPPLHNLTLSAFTDHVRHRSRSDYPSDVSFAKSDYDNFLKLYIELYVAHHGDQRAPLSAGELKYLAEIIRPCTLNIDMPRIASFFLSPDNRPIADEFVYWWSVEKSRECFVEDCLIPDSYISKLRGVANQPQNYPLSLFMQIFSHRNYIFTGISRDDSRGRAVIYFIILLYALQAPHLISFFPTQWLISMFDERDGAPLFDQLSTSVFGNTGLLSATKYTKCLLQKGYDVAAQKFTNFSIRGDRVFAAAGRASKQGPYDVQVIGPFGRTFGLGESCRIIGKTIQSLGYNTNFADFDAGAISPHEAKKYSQTVSPAQVNILHINAESIPDAIAYLPDVFTKAFNIGIVYWELNFPADCQMLGLKLMDEIWAPSDFVADSVRPYCRSVIKVGMACAAPPEMDRDKKRNILGRYDIADDEFIFLHTSDALSRAQRKNPIGAIRAFFSAFPADERVRLVIKTHNAAASDAVSREQRRIWKSVEEVATSDRRLVFIDETLSSADHRMLVASADCLMALHRAEGFGLDILYAMRCGVPVLATGYSGNLEFCTDQTSWLVGYRTVPVMPGEYPFVEPGHTWAEPNHDDAVFKMREIFRNPTRRSAIARNAQKLAAARFSFEALSERVGGRLNQLLGVDAASKVKSG